MFCPQCGIEINEKDKFCPKCGHAIEEKDDHKQTTTAAPTQDKNKDCLSCLFIFLIILALFTFSSIFLTSDFVKNRSTELNIGIIIFSLVFLILGVWGLVNQSRKKGMAPENKTIAPSTPKEVKKTSSSCVAILAICFIAATLFVIYFGAVANKPGTKKSPTKSTPTTADQKHSWDGNYDVKMIKPNCDSSVEFTSFQVTDNEFVNLWGKNAPISKSGYATIIMDTGAITTTKLKFDDDGASGTWKTSRGCSGTLTATKSAGWF